MTHDKALYKSTITLTLSLAGTHFHRVEGRRLLAWVVGNTKTIHTQTITHLGSNRAQRSVTYCSCAQYHWYCTKPTVKPYLYGDTMQMTLMSPEN